MIKVDRGTVEINGNLAQLSAETSVILRAFYQHVLIGDHNMDEKTARSYLQNIVDASFLSNEEVQAKSNELLQEIILDFTNIAFK